MTDVLSELVALSDGVRAWFATHDTTITVPPVGFKQRFEKLNEGTNRAGRVLFIPGIVPGGDVPDVVDMGTIARNANRSATTNPRQLFEWEFPFTMSVWAVDASSADAVNDEQKQLIASTNLFEKSLQAVHNARVPVNPNDPTQGYRAVGFGNVRTPAKVRVVKRNREMAFGLELLVVFTAKSPLFDRSYDVATPTPVVNRHLIVP